MLSSSYFLSSPIFRSLAMPASNKPGPRKRQTEQNGQNTQASTSAANPPTSSTEPTTTSPSMPPAEPTAAGPSMPPAEPTATSPSMPPAEPTAAGPSTSPAEASVTNWATTNTIDTPVTGTPAIGRANTTLATPASGHGGISYTPAQVGGISVGTSIGGAVLTLAALFLFLWFKRHPRQLLPAIVSVPLKSITTSERDHVVLDYLPQRIDDSTLERKMRKLCVDVERCADVFFNNPDPRVDASTVAKLQDLAGAPVCFTSWLAALSNPETHKLAIRLLIAQTLFACIDTSSGTAEATLLPPHLLSMYQDLKRGQDSMGENSGRGPNLAERREILSIWRQISGFFLPKDHMSPQMHSATSRIANVLAELSPEPRERFVRVLEGLVRDAGQLGLELVKSPDEWSPIWDSLQKDNGIVVFPGLECVRTSYRGEQGHPIETRFELCSAVVIHPT
ncbi:hypothetical protein B0I35DRAFT_515680 [Stachybotrys elegans]|uniref:Uncharacterized protein n=1 Tax=Stachybotrys elegans TaxID=80388 RepID=A0A8K0SM71_9HYPO|nr:hypothetical protein B0I35DRAFT_515680 [Stachybotrys elegans]